MLDFFNVDKLLGVEERQVRAAAREYLEREFKPHVAQWFHEGDLPKHVAPAFGQMGFLGANLPTEYGGAGLSNLAYGVLSYELERVDAGLRSFASVQSSLVMYPIYAFGSEEQKQRYLPKLASGEMIGCFGLTESGGGSDPGAMYTTAKKDGDGYVLNGSKMWITNGNLADIAVVWAKCDDGSIRGFIVPTDAEGFTANLVKQKMSLRASVTSELVFEDVKLPADSVLPGALGLKGPLSCLTQARFGIAWGALGALEAVYTEALEFAMSRETFGGPIASRQLVQHKLVEMVTEHTKGLLLAYRLATLKDAGEMNHVQVSLAKRSNVREALKAARVAREILGGSGITLEYNTIRHMLNLETVDTYEGTYDIHTLVVGRDLTGLNAFA